MREFSYRLCVTEADFWSISSMLDEPVMSWNTGLANSLKWREVKAITLFKVIQGIKVSILVPIESS